MPRYKLRTLLIVLTGACVFFGWYGYVLRMAAFHRRESASLITRMSTADDWPRQEVESAVQWLSTDANAERIPLQVGDGSAVSYWSRAAEIKPFAQAEPRDWERAVYHQKSAAIYNGALFRPWTLLSLKRAP